jgi:hypothetical protein
VVAVSPDQVQKMVFSNFLDMELDKILMKLSPGNQIRYKFSVEVLGLTGILIYCIPHISKKKIRRAK